MARGAARAWHQIEIRDQQLLASLDHTHAEAASLAGERLACRLGCTQCCHGPFHITPLDAWRLRRGLEKLSPARARAVRARVEAYCKTIQSLPVDDDGLPLGADTVACPALNAADGSCDLYEWRPVTCRVFGPLVRLDDGALGHCELCYSGTPDEDKRALAVEFDPEGLEENLLKTFGEAPTTLVALALRGVTKGEI